jgi:hypothetical protein
MSTLKIASGHFKTFVEVQVGGVLPKLFLIERTKQYLWKSGRRLPQSKSSANSWDL